MSQLVAVQDVLLTAASQAYVPKQFICEQVLPMIGVVQSTGKLAKYGTNHLRIETAGSLKGGRGKFRQVEPITRSTTSYSIIAHGLETLVSKEDYKNVQNPFDAERDAVLGLTTMLYLEKEKALADAITDTSVITQYTTLSSSSQWSDFANSDPVANSITAKNAILDGCGMVPNVAIMGPKTFNTVRFHPAILTALGYKYTKPGGVVVEDLAIALGVEKILIGNSYYESAAEGATSSLAPVWGKDVVFAVCPDKAELYQVSMGYRVQYANEGSRKVFKMASFNPPEATSILCSDEYQFLISNAKAAYCVKAAIA